MGIRGEVESRRETLCGRETSEGERGMSKKGVVWCEEDVAVNPRLCDQTDNGPQSSRSHVGTRVVQGT